LDLFKKFDKTLGAYQGCHQQYGKTSPERTYEDAMKRRAQDPWNFLFIAGMWFQDSLQLTISAALNVHHSYGTQQGENQLLRVQHRCGLAQHHRKHAQERHRRRGYKNHGKHEIYAKGKNVNLGSYEHSLVIDADDASRVRHLEHDIPLTAAEENRIRRKMAL